MRVSLGDTIYVRFFTHSSTGALTDADSTPTVDVTEDGGTAFTTGVTVANVTTGEYKATIVCSGANGFELGKWYEVAAKATVGSVQSGQSLCRFQAMATPTTEGVPEVDVTHFRGEAVPATFSTGVPFVGLADATISEAKFGGMTSGGRSLLKLLAGIRQMGAPAAVGAATITLQSPDDGGIAASATNDAYKGCIVCLTRIVGGNSTEEDVRTITAYNGTTKVATVDRAWTSAAGDYYEIYAADQSYVRPADVQTWLGVSPNSLASGRVDATVGAMQSNTITSSAIASGAITATGIAADAIGASELAASAVAEIADAVWDEAISGHLTAGTTGATLNGASAPSAASVADAVWDEARSGHVAAGSFGEGVIVSSLTTAALEAIRDKLLDYAYRSGRTVRGLFRRLGASLEFVTGLNGSTVTFKQPDNSTTEYTVTQDTSNGSRSAVNVTNSETP